MLFRSGDTAPMNGVYEAVDDLGRPMRVERALKATETFPTIGGQRVRYRYLRAVHVVYGTATSSATLDQVSGTYSDLLKRLADR